MITSKYVKTGETKKYSMFISPAHQRDISNNSGKKKSNNRSIFQSFNIKSLKPKGL